MLRTISKLPGLIPPSTTCPESEAVASVPVVRCRHVAGAPRPGSPEGLVIAGTDPGPSQARKGAKPDAVPESGRSAETPPTAAVSVAPKAPFAGREARTWIVQASPGSSTPAHPAAFTSKEPASAPESEKTGAEGVRTPPWLRSASVRQGVKAGDGGAVAGSSAPDPSQASAGTKPEASPDSGSETIPPGAPACSVPW